MLALALESATMQVGVALGTPEGVLASFHSTRPRRHAETMAPAVDFVCRQAGVGLDEVTVVAVDVGPGLFTGLRVGIATAKAIAYARGLPMVGVTSLDVLAYPARVTHRRVVSVIDARRGEVYYAGYAGTRRLTEPRAGSPEEVAASLRSLGGDVLLVGDGARRHAGVLGAVEGVEIALAGFRFPSAESLVEMAVVKARSQEVLSEGDLEPFYLRPPDADLPSA